MISRDNYISPSLLLYAGLILGLVGIALFSSLGNLHFAGVVILSPLILLLLTQSIRRPVVFFFLLFIQNYFLTAVMRYANITRFSVVMDILLFGTIVIAFTHSIITKKMQWKNTLNVLTITSLIWLMYCLLEVANPSAVFSAWMNSRIVMYNGLLAAYITNVLIVEKKELDVLLMIFSVLSLLAALKGIYQKFVGFDSTEQIWLANGGAKTHIIATGTRYFSFFTDAGNWGSNMGMAGAMFGIVAIYTKNHTKKIYYIIVALLSLWGMFLSGTRGAIFVPLAALVLFALLSKRVVLFTTTGILLALIYVFFVFTNIGQGNQQIRRMRTAFKPSQDASFNVRTENKKKLAVYLRNKPFGEGLGLGGVESQKYAMRVTTVIPHDSAYVKIWMETGIVGLVIFLGGLGITLSTGCYKVLFKVKDRELQGTLSSMLCGVFGLLVSAYGNAFLTQFPTQIIVYSFLAVAMNAEVIDKSITNKQEPKTLNIE